MVLVISIAQAQTRVIKSGLFQTPVLEFYSSDGCSCCPPADQWLSKVIKLPRQELDILALTFHVEKLDYTGWKDPFTSPKHNNRQYMSEKIQEVNYIISM